VAGARSLIKESGHGSNLESQLEGPRKLLLDARAVRSDFDLLCVIWISRACVMGIHVGFSGLLKLMNTHVTLRAGEYDEVLFPVTKSITQTLKCQEMSRW